MKTQRRQELRTNELAQMLDEAREFFQRWGSYVVGGVLVVVVLVALIVYRAKAAEQALSDAWTQLSELQRNAFFTQSREKRRDDEIELGFTGLEELAAQAKDPALVFEALSSKGRIAEQLSMMAEAGVDAHYLDEAEEAYQVLRDRLPENALAVAVALTGLVNVEADRFVLDGDPSRKDEARRMLEQLAGEPRFNLTPFQMAAADRLNQLDAVFRPVELAPAPEPEPVATAPLMGPPAPLEGPPAPGQPALRADGLVEVKRLPGPPPGLAPAAEEAPLDEESGFTPAAPEDLAEPESDEDGDQQ